MIIKTSSGNKRLFWMSLKRIHLKTIQIQIVVGTPSKCLRFEFHALHNFLFKMFSSVDKTLSELLKSNSKTGL